MDLIEAIQTRHSVRKYTDQPIEVAKLATLREAIKKAKPQNGENGDQDEELNEEDELHVGATNVTIR